MLGQMQGPLFRQALRSGAFWPLYEKLWTGLCVKISRASSGVWVDVACLTATLMRAFFFGLFPFLCLRGRSSAR